MTDTTKPQGPRALIMQLGGILAEQGADYEASLDGSMLAFIGDAECGRCNGVIAAEIVDDDSPMLLLQVALQAPFESIPEDRWTALYELIGLLSTHLVIGHFEYDHEDDFLRWRAHQLMALDGPWDPNMLISLPVEGIDTIDSSFEAFSKVIGGDDPNIALAESLIEQSGGDPAELFGQEVLRMVKVARRRAKDDKALQDRATALLVKLTG